MAALTNSVTLVARVVRAVRRKTVTFLWCWAPPRLVLAIATGDVERPPTGAVVRLSGSWQPSRSKLDGFAPEEFLVEQCIVLAGPIDPRASGDHLRELDRGIGIAARGVAVREATQALRQLGVTRVEVPLFVGAAAEGGPTNAFTVVCADEHAHLPVNNLVWHQRLVAAGLRSIFSVSRLYWRHRPTRSTALAEIHLVELAFADRDRNYLVEIVETVLERIRDGLCEAFGPRGHLDASLSGLPQLSWADARRIARDAGVDVSADGHVLPSSVDNAVANRLGVTAYWLFDAPIEAAPYYADRIDDRSAASVELRLVGVGDCGAGSEWLTDVAEAEVRSAAWAPSPARETYLSMLRAGLPQSCGLSLGIDRTVMYLVGLSTVRSAALTRRAVPRAAPSAGVSVHRGRLVEPPTPAPANIDELAAASLRVEAACGWLEEQGFLPAATTLVVDGNAPSASAVSVDWFGRDVALASDRAPQLHALLAECPSPVYEIGPVVGRRCWQLDWVIDCAVVAPTIAALAQLGVELLSVLVDPAASPPVVVPSVEDLRPATAGSLRYVRGVSAPDAPAEALEWRVGANWGLRVRRWPSSAADGAPGLPAGGVSVNLGALPSIAWPTGPTKVDG